MLKTTARITIYQSQSPESLTSDNIGIFQPIAMQFYSYNSAEINGSWDQQTQTAKVVLPRRIVSIGAVNYSFNDYDNLSPNTFTQNIQAQICNGATGFSKPLKVSSFIPLIYNKIIPSATYSLIYNSNINNGNQYINGSLGPNITGSDEENTDATYRSNGLIQHGDMIVIQLGYIIEDGFGGSLDTITYGNVANFLPTFISAENIMSQPLPANLAYEEANQGFFNINNRWKPYNRGYQFRGYVDKIGINKEGNVEINCQDIMYLFNRAKFPNAVYNPSGPSNGIQPYDYFNSRETHGWTVNNIIIDSIVGKGNESQGIQNFNYLPRQVIPSTVNGIPVPNSITVEYNENIDMLVGKITTTNAAIGDLFKTLKNDYNIPCFFRPNTNILVTTPFVYNQQVTTPGKVSGVGYTKDPGSPGQEEFTFIMGQWSAQNEKILMNQGFLRTAPSGTYKNTQNIIHSDLEFKYTFDQPVSAIVKSIYKTDAIETPDQGASTADGRKRKNLIEHSISIGDAGGVQYTFFYLVTKANAKSGSSTINPGSPQNIFNADGSINLTNLTRAMSDYGYMMLSHVNYEGFYGSFTTYGYPYVQFCDIVNIVDFSFPERSGKFYTKQVIYKADVANGITQQIFLDYKIPNTNINNIK